MVDGTDWTLDLKRRAKLLIAPSVFLAIGGYFLWQATQGNRGSVARAERLELLRTAERDNAAARAELERWRTRVAGLQARHLNPDTLDERTRTMLHLADPNDIVVPYPEGQKLY